MGVAVSQQMGLGGYSAGESSVSEYPHASASGLFEETEVSATSVILECFDEAPDDT